METFLFHHESFKSAYDCSLMEEGEWSQYGVRRVNIGLYSMLFGIICMFFYLPTMKVMTQPNLWKNSCYKLMFYNGIIDIWGIVNSCFITGYFAVNGVVFCNYPTFIYLYGTTVMALWATQCMIVILLAFNRCVDFWQNEVLLKIFEGSRTYFVLLLPTIYFLCFAFFVPPSVYTSTVNMWVLDPFLGIPNITVDRTPYEIVWPLNINNILLLILLTTLYTCLILSVWYKRQGTNSVVMSKVQKQITIQAFLICMVIYITGGIYTLFEFFPNVPGFLMVICFFSWQMGFGGTVIIYMTLNRSIRRGVIAFYLKPFAKSLHLANYGSQAKNGSQIGASSIGPTLRTISMQAENLGTIKENE
ncbi:hypothetical protein L596_019651 [Steinernema carpocapsae]|uniref:7TM GPCR serpentine receptor class x (Srx) domain-containing protein n=1 Tax=Steinernema carpocapsae TaxID=34508 RepID=A0A4U5MR53_STECR|nr:hypothetical protein L596_019651 [Steinernema carpocapsae]